MGLKAVLFLVMIVLMMGALLSVIVGLIQRIKSPEKANLTSQKAMKMRLMFHGLALGVFGLLMFLRS